MKFQVKEIATACLCGSGIAYIATQYTGLIAMFIASALLLAFQSYLERKEDTELDALKAELTQLKSKVDGLSMAKGFGR